MIRLDLTKYRLGIAAVAILAAGGALGFGVARLPLIATPAPAPAVAARPVLYWYDPMMPAQHFDRPGKSPFMDMQLVPRYADEAGPTATPGVRIGTDSVQNAGMRVVKVRRGALQSSVTAPGVIEFNQRDVAIVQARTAGFVQRAYGRAPGDTIRAGTPLVDILAPEWAGAQSEYLAVRRTGNTDLIAASRQRLRLLGMPEGLITAVERTGRPITVTTVSSPIGGVVRTLSVRAGMSVSPGQTLAEVNGIGTVWLNVSIPESLSTQVRQGQAVAFTLTAYPGETFHGRVTAILPEAVAETRTLTARVELANAGGRLHPGMYGQVNFAVGGAEVLLVPSEAVIRTGTRTLVMLAGPGGSYRPAEVRTGREGNGETEITAGLAEGEQVVASGQFLIDSEATLSGVTPRPITGENASVAATAPPTTLVRATGRIEQITANSVTFSHGPIASLGWPAMTMSFALRDPRLTDGFRVGDRVTFAFDQPGRIPTVRQISRLAAGQ